MNLTQTLPKNAVEQGSGFRGVPATYYLANLFMLLVSIVSVSLLYPLAYILFERQKIDNTYIDGKKLAFCGKLSSVYGIYISGVLFAAISIFLINVLIKVLPLETNFLNKVLSAATAGVNVFFIKNRLRRWKWKNIHYDGEEPSKSYLGKNIIKCAFMGIFSSLISIITLGISYPLIYKIKESYYLDMSVIDGDDIYLNGKTAPLFGKWFLGLLLCVVTLGLFIPMLSYFLYGWKAENTHVKTFRPLVTRDFPATA